VDNFLGRFSLSFTNLHPDVVLDAVEAFGYEVNGRCYPLNSYENRVYQVGLETGGQLIAKFYRSNRWSLDQISEEHAFNQFLFKKSVSVGQSLEGHNDSCVLEIGGFYCSIQERILGSVPELEDLDSLYQLGQLIGEVHKTSKSWSFKKRNQFNVQAMGRENYQYLSNWLPKKQQSLYQKVMMQLFDKIENCLPADFESHFIAIHGDCHLSNVVMSDAGPVLIDFDDVMMGPAIQDIWMFLAGENHHQQLSELIDGYEESIEFPHEQLAWIPALRALRVINYSAWLAKRWSDPAFPKAFPWFNTEDYWTQHIKELQNLVLAFEKA
jgi:Ser/Thr protein kinase RdoA (MazF antagonist)